MNRQNKSRWGDCSKLWELHAGRCQLNYVVVAAVHVVVVDNVSVDVVDGNACCSDRYRGEEPSDYHYRGEEASDTLERMKPEEVYDSIRRTTADIRHYVKMESNTASPPSGRPSSSSSHRQDGGGGSGAGAGAYHLPVVRSPDRRLQQRYNQVCYRGRVSNVNSDISHKD